jgi:transposase
MGQRTYSNDLRSRVVAEVAAGMSRRKATRLYRVGVSSAIRWVGLHDETGSISPPRGGKSRSPLEPHADWLLKLVATEPDLTLMELEQRISDGLGLVTTENRDLDPPILQAARDQLQKNAARRRAGTARRR